MSFTLVWHGMYGWDAPAKHMRGIGEQWGQLASQLSGQVNGVPQPRQPEQRSCYFYILVSFLSVKSESVNKWPKTGKEN